MTPNQFRRLALALPGAIEGAHMGHADFRVGAKIFATLGAPDVGWGVVLLKPDQQALLLETAGHMFSPVPGGWGLKGGTRVNLAAADQAAVKNALRLAWEIRAPRAKQQKLQAERERPALVAQKRKKTKRAPKPSRANR